MYYLIHMWSLCHHNGGHEKSVYLNVLPTERVLLFIHIHIDSIHILGPLATTASLQQVPEPRRSRLPQLLHEHLGFVS